MSKLILVSLLLVISGGSSPVWANLIINELLIDPPPGLAGDANGDGVRNGGQDEFIELVNTADSGERFNRTVK